MLRKLKEKISSKIAPCFIRYRPYWHLFDVDKQLEIQQQYKTIGWFVRHYRQPEWCKYPEALSGLMGCWSLWYRNIHKETDCKNCDLYVTQRGEK